MADFYTDPQGRVRPISGKKGGGGAVVAAILGGMLTLGGTGVGAATSVGEAVDSAVGVGQSIPAKTASGKNAACKGQSDDAWRQMRLRPIKQAVEPAL